ncbi:MAG: hypothetical protein ACOX2F_00990 [bacterium]
MKKLFALFTVFLVFISISSCGGDDKKKSGASVCGDFIISGNEKCDGFNLNNKTCDLLGFGEGVLKCAENCLEFDTTGCGASVFCGDNIIDGTDVCDGTDLGGKECFDFGFEEGELRCLANCSGFDTSGCGKSMLCGNGKIDSGEVCDGSQLNGRTCVEEGFEKGKLKCSDDCMSFDTSDCSSSCTPECSGRECGPDPICGESCGECDGGFETCSSEGKCEKNCDLDPFTADRTLDINLETARVSGALSLNGSVPGAIQDDSRGYIKFINKENGNFVSVSIGNAGVGAYSIVLFKGVYEVVFSPENSSNQTVFPQVDVILEKELVVKEDVVKNYNLETVQINGAVSIDGKTMPNNTKDAYEERGSIRFTDNESGSFLHVSIGSSGVAAYSTKLYKKSYTATFLPNSENYQNAVPVINMILDKNITLNSDVTKNFNLETVNISGNITLNGSTMPNNTFQYSEHESRGFVQIINAESLSTLQISLGSSGVAAFNKTVYKGKYNLWLTPASSSNQNVLPSLSVILAKEVEIKSDMTKSFNLETFTVSGNISLNGSVMPNNTKQYNEMEQRGYINFKNEESGSYTSLLIGSSGVAAFSQKLFKGSYTVSLQPYSSNYQNVLPDLDLILVRKMEVFGNLQKEFNVETAVFKGVINLNGQSMPNNTEMNSQNEKRGSVIFKNKESGDRLWFNLGSAGIAAYSATLYKGKYDVILSPERASYQNVLPEIETILETNVVFNGPITKDYNVETVNITGTVTLNGSIMPNNTKQSNQYESRGFVVFRDKGTSDYLPVTIGSSGVGAYSTKLFKNSYDVDFSAENSSYQNVLPHQSVKIYRGCFDYSAGCDLDKDNITGTWEFVPVEAYWTPVVFYLTQNGEEITGTYEAYASSGSIEPGKRKGSYIKFQFKPYYDMIVEGTVVSGCVVLGRFDTIGYSGSNYDSDFVGYRVP